jgi:radical SAM superfamily enzyme YgiQ (UPF0313 family)
VHIEAENIVSGKVLIVDALSSGAGRRTSSRDSIGCGPRTVAGVFEKHDVSCRIVRGENILENGFPRNFTHLAISAMSMDLPACSKIVRLWKRKERSKVGRILVGGPVCAEPQKVALQLEPDALIIGEGEATLNELIEQGFFSEKIDLSDVRGLGYLNRNKCVVTDPREHLSSAELSSAFKPSTTRVLDYRAYAASRVYVEVVRGCSNYRRPTLPLPDSRHCSDCGNCDASDPMVRMDCPENIEPGCGFCSVPATWGPPRSRTKEAIVNEVQELLDLGVHRIVLEAPGFLDYMRGDIPLTDPCGPSANLKAIEELLDALTSLDKLSHGHAHLSIENIKACLFSAEVAELLASRLPGGSPNIGLETGSEYHSQQIGKCGRPSEVIDAVKTAKSYGLRPFIYLIYGLPGETPSTIENSLEILKQSMELGAERIVLYGFRPLPGSAFSDFKAPRHDDPLSESLRREVSKLNRRQKDSYVGSIIKGVAAEPSHTHHGYTIVYPLSEGPMMTVQGGYSPGAVVDVRITDVYSEGLLGGTVVRDDEG